MADFNVQGNVSLNTSQAERQLAAFAAQAQRIDIKIGGLDHRSFTQPLGRITGSVDEFRKSLDAANARVIAFSASAGVLFGITKGFKEMVDATIKVEKTLTDINVILNTSTQNLEKFSAGLFDVAKKTGQSFFEVGAAATEFARQGLSMEETLTRTRDALILMRLSGIDTQTAVNSLTAAINSFSDSALTSTEIINKMANVDASFAVSSRDLAEAISRVGSSAESVNVSFDELMGAVTAVQQTTARGGSVIGNSLKTIFARIQREDVVQQLKSLGVQVRDVEGNVRPTMVVLKELSKAYESLSPTVKSQTTELVGGVYQMNILKALLKDLGKEYSIFDRSVKISSESTNQATKRSEELNKTLSATLNESIQTLTELGAKVGKLTLEPAIKNVLSGINALSKEQTVIGDIGTFLGFDEKSSHEFGSRMAKGILQSLGSFISGPGLVLITGVIGKLIVDFGMFLGKATKDMFGMNKAAHEQMFVQQTIQSILIKNPELINAITLKQKNLQTVEQEIVNLLNEQINLRTKAKELSTAMVPGVMSLGVIGKTDRASGTVSLATKTKSHGHIPNREQERIGAIQAGYKPGAVKQMSIPGEGRVTYNDAEKVKKFPFFEQPAIMPPLESEAGKIYKKQFEKAHNFNPYSPRWSATMQSLSSIIGTTGGGRQKWGGFVPNFYTQLPPTPTQLAHLRELNLPGQTGFLARDAYFKNNVNPIDMNDSMEGIAFDTAERIKLFNYLNSKNINSSQIDLNDSNKGVDINFKDSLPTVKDEIRNFYGKTKSIIPSPFSEIVEAVEFKLNSTKDAKRSAKKQAEKSGTIGKTAMLSRKREGVDQGGTFFARTVNRGFVPNFAPKGSVVDFDGTAGTMPKGNVKTPSGEMRRMTHADTYHGWSAAEMVPTELTERIKKRPEPITILTARGLDSVPVIEDWLRKHNVPFERVIATGHDNYPEEVLKGGTPAKKAYELQKLKAQGIKFYEDSKINAMFAAEHAGIIPKIVDYGNEGAGQWSSGFIPNFSKLKRTLSEREVIDGDTIKGRPSEPSPESFRLDGVDAVEHNQRFGREAFDLLEDRLKRPNDLDIDSEKGGAFGRGLFKLSGFPEELIKMGYGVPDFRYTSNEDLKRATQEARSAGVGIWNSSQVDHPKRKMYLHQIGVLDEQEKLKESGKKGLTQKDLIKKLRYADSRDEFNPSSHSFGFIPNFAIGSWKAAQRKEDEAEFRNELKTYSPKEKSLYYASEAERRIRLREREAAESKRLADESELRYVQILRDLKANGEDRRPPSSRKIDDEWLKSKGYDPVTLMKNKAAGFIPNFSDASPSVGDHYSKHRNIIWNGTNWMLSGQKVYPEKQDWSLYHAGPRIGEWSRDHKTMWDGRSWTFPTQSYKSGGFVPNFSDANPSIGDNYSKHRNVLWDGKNWMLGQRKVYPDKHRWGEPGPSLGETSRDRMSMWNGWFWEPVGKSGGFIPNFSSNVQKALDTERAMGGDPVLDYDKRVGHFVRDGSTQNNFQDVLRDHPEGLQKAISNSRKIQNKTAAKGFVPNFEPTTNLDMGIIISSLTAAGYMIHSASQTMRAAAEKSKAAADAEKANNDQIGKIIKREDAKKVEQKRLSQELETIKNDATLSKEAKEKKIRLNDSLTKANNKALEDYITERTDREKNQKLLAEETQKAQKEARNAKISSGANIALAAAPILQGVLSATLSKDERTQAYVGTGGSAVSGLASGIMTGAMIGGPWGAAAGTALALGTLATSALGLSKQFDEIKRKQETEKVKKGLEDAQKAESDRQLFKNAQENLKSLIVNRADSKEILKAEKALQKAGQSRFALLSEEESTKKQEKAKEDKDALDIKQISQDLKGKTGIGRDMSFKEMTDLFSGMQKNFDINKIKGATDIHELMNIMGVKADISSLKGVDIGRLYRELKQVAEENSKNAEKVKHIVELQKIEAKLTAESIKKQESINNQISATNILLKTQRDHYIEIARQLNKIETAKKDFEIDFKLEELKLAENLISPFLRKDQIQKQKYQADKFQIDNDGRKKFVETITSGSEKSADIINNTFSQLSDRQAEFSKKPFETDKLLGMTEEEKRLQIRLGDFYKNLQSELQPTLKKLSDSPERFEEYNKELITLLEKKLQDKDLSKEAATELTTIIKKLEQNQFTTTLKIADETREGKQKRELLDLNDKYISAVNKLNQQLELLGGASDFATRGIGSLSGKSNEIWRIFEQNINKKSVGPIFQQGNPLFSESTTIKEGRAAFDVGDFIVKNFGDKILGENSELSKLAIGGRTEDLRRQASLLVQTQGGILSEEEKNKILNQDFKAAAEAQIGITLKTGKVPEHIEEIRKKIDSLSVEIAQKINQDNERIQTHNSLTLTNAINGIADNDVFKRMNTTNNNLDGTLKILNVLLEEQKRERLIQQGVKNVINKNLEDRKDNPNIPLLTEKSAQALGTIDAIKTNPEAFRGKINYEDQFAIVFKEVEEMKRKAAEEKQRLLAQATATNKSMDLKSSAQGLANISSEINDKRPAFYKSNSAIDEFDYQKRVRDYVLGKIKEADSTTNALNKQEILDDLRIWLTERQNGQPRGMIAAAEQRHQGMSNLRAMGVPGWASYRGYNEDSTVDKHLVFLRKALEAITHKPLNVSGINEGFDQQEQALNRLLQFQIGQKGALDEVKKFEALLQNPLIKKMFERPQAQPAGQQFQQKTQFQDSFIGPLTEQQVNLRQQLGDKEKLITDLQDRSVKPGITEEEKDRLRRLLSAQMEQKEGILRLIKIVDRQGFTDGAGKQSDPSVVPPPMSQLEQFKNFIATLDKEFTTFTDDAFNTEAINSFNTELRKFTEGGSRRLDKATEGLINAFNKAEEAFKASSLFVSGSPEFFDAYKKFAEDSFGGKGINQRQNDLNLTNERMKLIKMEAANKGSPATLEILEQRQRVNKAQMDKFIKGGLNYNSDEGRKSALAAVELQDLDKKIKIKTDEVEKIFESDYSKEDYFKAMDLREEIEQLKERKDLLTDFKAIWEKEIPLSPGFESTYKGSFDNYAGSLRKSQQMQELNAEYIVSERERKSRAVTTAIGEVERTRPEFGVFDENYTANLNTSIQSMTSSLELIENYTSTLKKTYEEQARMELLRLELQVKANELNRALFANERVAAKEAAIERKIRNQDPNDPYSIGDTFDVLKESWKYGLNDMNLDLHKTLMSINEQFKSGISSAFFDIIKGTKDVRTAFKDLFLSIADMALKSAIDMGVKSAFGAIAGGSSGGLVSQSGIQKFARGGMVLGGSGTKDDVPALLNRGEYVIRQSSVRKYGSEFFEKLNARKYASGGGVKDPQADLASQLELLQGNRGASAKFNLRNSFVYDDDKFPTLAGSRYEIDQRLSRRALIDSNNSRTEIRKKKAETLNQYLLDREQGLEEYKKELENYKLQKKSGFLKTMLLIGGVGVLGTALKGKSSGKTPMSLWERLTAKKSSGGAINGQDNIPALLMGGEYVMNKEAVSKYGANMFRELNKGLVDVPRFADGGYVGGNNPNSNGNVSSLSDNSTKETVNNISINVNITNGEASTDATSSSVNEGQARDLSEMIKNQVVQTIIQQKRQGGILYNKNVSGT